MKIIGITGSSGAGKTTLTKVFQKNYNSYTIDADEVARKLTNDSTTTYFKEMIKLFGKEVLQDSTTLDRKKVASIIYKDKTKRHALNKLTFRYVAEDVEKDIEENKTKDFDYIVIDVPLLYEARMETLCDYVIAVVAEDDEKIARIVKRDNVTPEIAKQRLKIQNDNEFFVKKADFVIYNNGSIEKLEDSLKEIIEKLC